MNKITKFGSAVLAVAVTLLFAGCYLFVEEGIELGVHGGTSRNDAYPLPEVEYVYGYFPRDTSDSRWFSIPVTKDRTTSVWLYNKKDNSSMMDVSCYLYREDGSKFTGGPRGDCYFTPAYTGKVYVEAINNNESGHFAVGYTYSLFRPNKLW